MPHGDSPRHQRKRKPASRKKSPPPKKTSPKPKGPAKQPAARAGRAKAKGQKHGRGGGDRSAEGPADELFDSRVRLQKLLAAAGFGSRRDCEDLLRDERVTVNGRVVELGERADPRADEIRVDGERLVAERPAYWILHKPRGVVTTVRDEEGRRTVLDLMPPSVGRVFPVGRLDRETSGLLLLTNDGDTAHALLHPSLGNEREYRVNVKGRIDDKAIERLEKGLVLEEGRTAPARVASLRWDPDQGTSSFSLTLVEGRKRQIRRSLLVLGFPVRRLVRVRMGPLRLGRLGVGEARPLRAAERRVLLEHVTSLREGTSKDSRRGRPASQGSRTQRAARSRKGPRR